MIWSKACFSCRSRSYRQTLPLMFACSRQLFSRCILACTCQCLVCFLVVFGELGAGSAAAAVRALAVPFITDFLRGGLLLLEGAPCSIRIAGTVCKHYRRDHGIEISTVDYSADFLLLHRHDQHVLPILAMAMVMRLLAQGRANF